MVTIDKAKLLESRTALDAHRYTLADGYMTDQLRFISMLLDSLYVELQDHDYAILKQEGGTDEPKPN